MSTVQSLKDSGLKAPPPRRKILELFETSKVRHLSAEDVYRKLIEAAPFPMWYRGPDLKLGLVNRVVPAGEPLPVYGDGRNVRDWLHVDDHCRGIHLVLEGGRAGEVYNIGGGTELTNKELTQLLLDATGRDWDSYVTPVADRKGHDRRYSVDWSKIAAETVEVYRRALEVHKS